MKECGVVLEVMDQKAVVNIKRRSACGHCKSCEMGRSDVKELNVIAKNEIGAKIDDNVNIIMDTPDVLKAALIVYVIPLIALVIGVALGTFLAKKLNLEADLIGIITGLIFLAPSYLIVRKMDKKLEVTKKYEPIITEIVGKNIL